MKTSIFCVAVALLMTEASPIVQDQLFKYIDDHQEAYVEKLKEWVAIESDSSDPTKRQLVIDMMRMAETTVQAMGGQVQMAKLADQELPDGQKLPLPPVLLADLGSDPKKRTVCFYGHLDVQPAKKQDGWDTEPYTLVDKNGNLYGRGTSDDKGQVLAFLHAIQAAQVNGGLPVNVKLLIEGMEEVGSNGLDELVEQKLGSFLAKVDYFVIPDAQWSSSTPGITYAARGNCYFFLEVRCARRDLHSGGFGGTIHEAMSDLIYLLDTLVSASGHILIPGIYDAVAPVTEEEKKLYASLTFSLDDFKADAGTDRLLHDTKEKVLMYNWRYPSLSIHGIEGAFSGTGTKTVIPAKVIGKFSIRQVPNMVPSVVEKLVTDYLLNKFAERKSPNKVKVSMVIGAKPWISERTEPQYVAAQKAVRKVFQVDADMIRSGGTIPVAKTLQDLTGKSIMILGIGGVDDAGHGQNEKISRHNYINGTKLFAAFMHELGSL